MNAIRYAVAVALAVLLAACGKDETAPPPEPQGGADGNSAPHALAEVYSGTGTVQSTSGGKVTIAHGPIEGIGWPAMTMSFSAPPGMAKGIKSGARVNFRFRQDGSTYVLTSLQQL